MDRHNALLKEILKNRLYGVIMLATLPLTTFLVTTSQVEWAQGFVDTSRPYFECRFLFWTMPAGQVILNHYLLLVPFAFFAGWAMNLIVSITRLSQS